MRRFAFGTLLCPEFPLRYPPRITVRGQTVQGGGGTLRKAPLPSMVCPWSTRRHCGPLAFRRATEGSRVLRRVWGSQEGAREPYGALAPFCPPRRGHGVPRPPKAATVHAHFERKVTSSGKPLYRRKGLPSADGIVKGALRRSFLTSNAFRFIIKAKKKSRRHFYHGSF